MHKAIRIIKNSNISLERKYKGVVDQLSTKLRDVELANQSLESRLREREKVPFFQCTLMILITRSSILSPTSIMN